MQSEFEWLDDSSFIWPERDQKGDVVEWRRFDVKSGKRQLFFDHKSLEKALVSAGASEEEAKNAAKLSSQSLDAKKNAIVVEANRDLFLYTISTGKALRLTSSAGEKELPHFSPDGRAIAFVRDHNLFTVEIATQRERQLTTGGDQKTLNGKLDWVYEEEVYGRGEKRGYWWSPDSSRIAFL